MDRFSRDDLDALQILHNAKYLLLFERTLGSFWEHLGFGSFQEQREQAHLVRANAIEYLRPFRGTGNVRVRVWIEGLGTTSLTFGFRLMPMDSDAEHAMGQRVIVRIDPRSGRPDPWTEAFRDRLKAWLPEPA